MISGEETASYLPQRIQLLDEVVRQISPGASYDQITHASMVLSNLITYGMNNTYGWKVLMARLLRV
jgi:hypothetical protein